MNYEEAYKAVLKTATQWIKDGCTDKERICLECVFPELKESEDEKARKGLINFLNQQEISNRITFEAKQFWLAYLEKQKENPKTADSIPENCTSDAKCEDRWYKVADFLPDSGRDVLAKDALGNCLLASFDGDQWFVSVYDGEDKPIVYTPSIKEWCDIPSKKQEKQKPVEWSEDDEEMLEYIIGDVNDAKQLYTTKAAKDMADKEIAWLKSLRPQWRPSEEQLVTLLKAEGIVRVHDTKELAADLAQLYEQLKKLKEDKK